ncbi:UNVERIFIED_CONTAM: hypothetical protein K2H54_042856 [Gekko kuhli]
MGLVYCPGRKTSTGSPPEMAASQRPQGSNRGALASRLRFAKRNLGRPGLPQPRSDAGPAPPPPSSIKRDANWLPLERRALSGSVFSSVRPPERSGSVGKLTPTVPQTPFLQAPEFELVRNQTED